MYAQIRGTDDRLRHTKKVRESEREKQRDWERGESVEEEEKYNFLFGDFYPFAGKRTEHVPVCMNGCQLSPARGDVHVFGQLIYRFRGRMGS